MINVAVECASTIDVPQDISQELVEARARKIHLVVLLR